jgi:type IV pilus assembly protein PilE
MKLQKGFTLIDLMVTVSIIGILAAIAYPSYTSYLMKGRRASAQAHLLDIAQRQQQYLLDARAYADSTTLNVTAPSDVSTYYTITIAPINAAGAPPTFTASAAPKAGSAQVNDQCGTLVIDNTGNKTAGKAGCW